MAERVFVDFAIETDEPEPGVWVATSPQFPALKGEGSSSTEAAADLVDKARPVLERISGARRSSIKHLIEISDRKKN